MLPDPQREAEAIMRAFHECSLGLHHLNEGDLDDTTRERIKRLKELMDTTEIAAPEKHDRWLVKAMQFSPSQKREVAELVDDLANFFDRTFYTLTA
jgi:hypothetical protein